jgi:ribosomal-protein-serine acetyltransferase
MEAMARCGSPVDAKFVRAFIVTHTGGDPQISTPRAFVEPRVVLLSSGSLIDFHEWEIESRTEIIGALAVRRSRYAKQGLHDSKPYGGTGTKFFQFARLQQGWRIMSVAWIDDPALG